MKDTHRHTKPTDAQAAAMTRNFRIFRLRSLARMVSMLSPPRAAACLALIDAELIDHGADTTAVHLLKVINETKPLRHGRGLKGW